VRPRRHALLDYGFAYAALCLPRIVFAWSVLRREQYQSELPLRKRGPPLQPSLL
jgi:hypothetical protein